MRGTIVIGEGERDEAPMLWIGEPVGQRLRRPAADRHRGRPAGGHQPGRPRPGQRHHRARRVRGGRPAPRPGHLPREAVRRARSRPATWTSAERRPRTCAPSPTALRRDVRRHHHRHPRAATPRGAHRGGPRRRRAHQAHHRRRPVGGHQLRRVGHRRPRRHGHRRRAGGRPHGRRAASAWAARSRRASGSATTRSAQRAERMGATTDEDHVFTTEDLAPGENLVFAATGVTERRPARRRALLRRRRPHPLAGDGLPDQAGPLRGHRPHVRPRQAARRPAVVPTSPTRPPRP